MQNERILITGATGLVGSRLTNRLRDQNFSVLHLGRSQGVSGVSSYTWNVDESQIDERAFEGVGTIVHLAGASVAPRRWTARRKKEIMDSRVLSTRLLFDTCRRIPNRVHTLICASGINYYGFNDSGRRRENDPPGSDFLSRVTQAWEKEADKFTGMGVRVVKLRIGTVLSRDGGALKPLALPVKFFAGAPLGSGKQPVSWIHIDDLCGIILKAIAHPQLHGAYNAVAPGSTTNADMTRAIGKILRRPILLPRVPAWVLRIVLGELSEIVLKGSEVSSEKIQEAGYAFTFPELIPALKDTLK